MNIQNNQTDYPESDLHTNYLPPQQNSNLTIETNQKANTTHESLSKLT